MKTDAEIIEAAVLLIGNKRRLRYGLRALTHIQPDDSVGAKIRENLSGAFDLIEHELRERYAQIADNIEQAKIAMAEYSKEIPSIALSIATAAYGANLVAAAIRDHKSDKS